MKPATNSAPCVSFYMVTSARTDGHGRRPEEVLSMRDCCAMFGCAFLMACAIAVLSAAAPVLLVPLIIGLLLIRWAQHQMDGCNRDE